MLTNTFCHIPGIGEKTEQNLWSAGITSWDVAALQEGVKAATRGRRSWTDHIQESISNYANRNVRYFADKLPANQQWRLYRDFQGSCAFLDIETTGFFPGEITTIALYDGHMIRYFVNGQNLGEFVEAIRAYSLLVTYNGKTFDIPFIQGYFGIHLTQAHIDLRYTLRNLGLTGGLKACERRLDLERSGLEKVDGFLAVLLWNDYRRRGNPKALETLLAYNIQDAVSLHALMVHAHNEKVKATPFSATHALPTARPPGNPFKADPDTVNRLLHQVFGS